MNNNNTIDKMRGMRLQGMADIHYHNLQEHTYKDYTIDQYTTLLVDQEWEHRQQRKIKSLIQAARFKLDASVTDIDYSAARDLDRNMMERLVTLDFITSKQNIIITGPTGVGKSYLAQALGRQACAMLIKTAYHNASRLMEDIKQAKIDGSYLKLLKRLQRFPLLIIDDFGLHPFDNVTRQALMDLIEDRYDKTSTIVTSQIPVNAWHEIIGEGTIADAILDRLVNSSHRIKLKGESMRKGKLNQ